MLCTTNKINTFIQLKICFLLKKISMYLYNYVLRNIIYYKLKVINHIAVYWLN